MGRFNRQLPAHRALLPLVWLVLALSSAAARSDDLPATLAGKLLVASTEMGDPRFVETVIYMVKHDDEGALGLIINRPLAKGPIGDLLESLGLERTDSKGEIIIHYGGPVSQNQGFVLHSDEVVVEKSIRVKDGIAMSSDAKLLEAISQGKGPRQYFFMLGYSGWAPGQLEAEIKAGAWHVIVADRAFVFDDSNSEKKWSKALDRREIAL